MEGVEPEGAVAGTGVKLRYGPVHLDVTDREGALAFWRDVVLLEEIETANGEAIALGAGGETLIVLHPGAERAAMRGHSGLYHVAIHIPSEAEFARALARLFAHRYPNSPTDHVMSKTTYLWDADGLGLEFTLETPERMRSWASGPTGPVVIDSEGRSRSGRDPLDVEEVLSHLADDDLERPLPAGTKVGHVHLHVDDLEAGRDFYRDLLGFQVHVDDQRIGMVDFHTGGRFPHELALNVWQGPGAPQPPAGTAGLRRFTLVAPGPAELAAVTERLDRAGVEVERASDGSALVRDPAGNAIELAA
jgi:catechol 2,3-dioxygenase